MICLISDLEFGDLAIVIDKGLSSLATDFLAVDIRWWGIGLAGDAVVIALTLTLAWHAVGVAVHVDVDVTGVLENYKRVSCNNLKNKYW